MFAPFAHRICNTNNLINKIRQFAFGIFYYKLELSIELKVKQEEQKALRNCNPISLGQYGINDCRLLTDQTDAILSVLQLVASRVANSIHKLYSVIIMCYLKMLNEHFCSQGPDINLNNLLWNVSLVSILRCVCVLVHDAQDIF